MTVRIRLFAQARECAGRATMDLALPAPASVRALIRDVSARGGAALANVLAAPGTRVAVNQELVELDHPIRDGDEVAVLPRVTGG
jgi:sulfur-carrier protein